MLQAAADAKAVALQAAADENAAALQAAADKKAAMVLQRTIDEKAAALDAAADETAAALEAAGASALPDILGGQPSQSAHDHRRRAHAVLPSNPRRFKRRHKNRSCEKVRQSTTKYRYISGNRKRIRGNIAGYPPSCDEPHGEATASRSPD